MKYKAIFFLFIFFGSMQAMESGLIDDITSSSEEDTDEEYHDCSNQAPDPALLKKKFYAGETNLAAALADFVRSHKNFPLSAATLAQCRLQEDGTFDLTYLEDTLAGKISLTADLAKKYLLDHAPVFFLDEEIPLKYSPLHKRKQLELDDIRKILLNGSNKYVICRVPVPYGGVDKGELFRAVDIMSSFMKGKEGNHIQSRVDQSEYDLLSHILVRKTEDNTIAFHQGRNFEGYIKQFAKNFGFIKEERIMPQSEQQHVAEPSLSLRDVQRSNRKNFWVGFFTASVLSGLGISTYAAFPHIVHFIKTKLLCNQF